MRVLALTKYGSLAASFRQRFQLYEKHLAKARISVEYSALFDNDYLRPVMQGGRPSVGSVLGSYWRRLKAIFRAREYDVIWLHCEFLPYWPGFFEALAAKLVGRPIVFDYDDAIFHLYDESPSRVVRFFLSGKLGPLLRRVSTCLCGNDYLREYAARFCDNCIVLPTVVDTDRYRPVDLQDETGPLIIGWIGSPSTWENVRPLLPLLRDICARHRDVTRAIGAGQAAEADRFPELELADWREETESDELQRMDVGIMPLLDLPFQRGKSGYKLIQYMACGLPVVASPVGVNREIVKHGENGLLAEDLEQWRNSLTRLINDRDLRKSMGSLGRQSAEANYSLAVHARRLVNVFRSLEPPSSGSAQGEPLAHSPEPGEQR